MLAVMKHQKLVFRRCFWNLFLQINFTGSSKPGNPPEQLHMFVSYVEIIFNSCRPTVSNTFWSSRRQCWFRCLIDWVEH